MASASKKDKILKAMLDLERPEIGALINDTLASMEGVKLAACTSLVKECSKTFQLSMPVVYTIRKRFGTNSTLYSMMCVSLAMGMRPSDFMREIEETLIDKIYFKRPPAPKFSYIVTLPKCKKPKERRYSNMKEAIAAIKENDGATMVIESV